MENKYEAFYEFVKKTLAADKAGDNSKDKIERIASVIELMEIMSKE